jgi:hypothetical protein
MYRDRYFEIQRCYWMRSSAPRTATAQVRGSPRIVALALTRAQQRGAVKALRAEAARGMEAIEAAKLNTPIGDFAPRSCGLPHELQHRADLIESGEVTP